MNMRLVFRWKPTRKDELTARMISYCTDGAILGSQRLLDWRSSEWCPGVDRRKSRYPRGQERGKAKFLNF